MGVERLTLGVEMLHEVDETTLVMERLGASRLLAFVGKADLQTAVQEGRLAETGCHRVVVEDRGLLERHRARPEPDGGPGLLDRLHLLRVAGLRLALVEFLVIHLTTPSDLGLEPGGERIDHRHADTVETAGDGVCPLFELAPGVECGEHRGQGRALGLGQLLDRDAAAIVDHLDPTIGPERHIDAGAVACHRLVDRVVHHLPDQVMKTAWTSGPDVHPGTPLDRLETLEDCDVLGFVAVTRGRHDPPFGSSCPPPNDDLAVPRGN